MKNIIKLLIVVCALLCMVPCIGKAEDNHIIYDFYYENGYDTYITGNTNAEYEWKDHSLYLLTQNGPDDGGTGDPMIFYDCEDFDADEYYWMKLRIINKSNATYFQMHYDAGAGIAATSNTLYSITPNDTEYKEYVFNVKEANLATSAYTKTTDYPFDISESTWTGTIQSLRLDCMFTAFPGGQITTGSEFYIEYIGIFKSEADAMAFSIDRSITPSPEPTQKHTPEPIVKVTFVPTATKTPITTESSEVANKPSFDYMWFIIGGVAIILVVIIVLVIIKKKKKV